MEKLFEDLNSAQIEAVKTTEGPVMAIAGAGSGKTRVLTRRMAHLIFNLGVDPDRILAITFTNKAATEMKDRIVALHQVPRRAMWVSTFHSMCARILREHIDKLGYDKHFQILDDDDTTQMIKVLLKTLNIDAKMFKPRSLKNYLMDLKSDPEAIEDYEDPLKGVLKQLLPLYQRQLKDSNLVDFEDLLLLTIELLKTHRVVRSYYQSLFQYVMVDEFQDTNDVQYRLVKLLVNKNENIFIVGDEDQSIYAFRGANIANIRKFENDYPKVKRILLEQNYRSTNTILKAANNVISSNKHRIVKNLYSTHGDGDPIVFFKGYTYRDETEYVSETIRRLTHQGYRYEDIAVLYRANATSRPFEDTFLQKNIPYQVVGNLSFFKRKEIKDMVAYMRLIINPDDNYSFRRIVNEPRRGIGNKTLDRLSAFSAEEDESMFALIDHKDNPLGNAAIGKLKLFKQMVLSLREAIEQLDFNTFMDLIIEKTGYKDMLQFDDMGAVRYENILELKTMLQENERAFKDADKIEVLTYVLEDIALKSQEDETKDSNVVTLMTLHGAKGLEFRAVFVVACEQGMFPLFRSMESTKALEEERRLMYVGMTRAKEKLFITNAKQRQLYGSPVMHTDSQFITEIGPDYLKLEGLNKAVSQSFSQSARPRKPVMETVENALQKGDKIEHKTFGRGVVINVVKEQCVIAFGKEYGIKTLLKDHAALKKV